MPTRKLTHAHGTQCIIIIIGRTRAPARPECASTHARVAAFKSRNLSQTRERDRAHTKGRLPMMLISRAGQCLHCVNCDKYLRDRSPGFLLGAEVLMQHTRTRTHKKTIKPVGARIILRYLTAGFFVCSNQHNPNPFGLDECAGLGGFDCYRLFWQLASHRPIRRRRR